MKFSIVARDRPPNQKLAHSDTTWEMKRFANNSTFTAQQSEWKVTRQLLQANVEHTIRHN